MLFRSQDYDVVNVEQDHRYRDFWQTYHRMMERRGVTVQIAKIEMRRRLTLIAGMLLHKGDVDGLICGTWGTTAHHLDYLDQVIGKREGVNTYACMNGLLLPNRQVFLLDTHVNCDPTAEQLAEITTMAFSRSPSLAPTSWAELGQLRVAHVRGIKAIELALAGRAGVEVTSTADACLGMVAMQRVDFCLLNAEREYGPPVQVHGVPLHRSVLAHVNLHVWVAPGHPSSNVSDTGQLAV